jgi:glycosyltransferase involved in cell wall biosynthesis
LGFGEQVLDGPTSSYRQVKQVLCEGLALRTLMTGCLKVLFITAWYPIKESPMWGIFVREHAKAVNLYDDIVLLHMVGHDQGLKGWWTMKKETDESLTEGIPTYRIWYRRASVPKVSYLISIWSVVQAFRRIRANGFRPDIIHAHVYEAAVPAVIIGKLYGIPVVVTEHLSEFPRGLLRRLKVWKAKFSYKLADVVMPVSRFLEQSIKKHGIQARFLVVPNVVDTQLFYPNPDPRPERDLKRLLVVGSLESSHNKGLQVLFNALSKLRMQRGDWHLDVVGHGPAGKEYERMVKALGLTEKVTFCGFKTKQEVAEYMRQADLFVLPSLFETFSVAAAEALLTGTPVLATRCGGPEEFLTDDVALTVPSGDAKALRDGLDYMLHHLEVFSPHYISNNLFGICKKVLKRHI